MRAGICLTAIVLMMSLLMASPVHAAAITDSEVKIGTHHNIRAVLFAPDGAGPYPGVLVLHPALGVMPPDLAYAKRLAEAGYVALVPAYASAYGDTQSQRLRAFTIDAEAIYADLLTGIDLLNQTSTVDHGKIGVVGFSMGGFFATWLAGTHKVQAAVSYYGALSFGVKQPEAVSNGLFTAQSAPILILHGEKDTTQPVHVAHGLGRIPEKAGSPFKIHIYPNAEHSFDRIGPQDVRDDAWARTTAFLGYHLRGQPCPDTYPRLCAGATSD